MSSGSGTMTPCNDDLNLLQRATTAVIYEATLQDLLRCNNNTVHWLLSECNELLHER
jgi:hypothetical protein